MRNSTRRLLLSLLAGCATLACGAGEPKDLPLVRVPAAGGTDPMMLLLTGDGDWASFVRELAQGAAAAGSPVLALKSRSYLAVPRTPEEIASDLETAVRAALEEWHRERVTVVGYSRGADLVPFVLNRWPAELRARVERVVLIGPGRYVSFQFHFDDLVLDVRRPSDLPIEPELEKLAGFAVLCIRGEDERSSACDLPGTGMKVAVHGGGHRAKAGDGTSELVLRELGLGRN